MEKACLAIFLHRPGIANIESILWFICLFFRARHGVGQCCVDIRAILQGHCPNIKTFCGLILRESSGRMKSKQQVKKLLHEDYVASGGALGLTEWSKGYWRGRNLNMASGYFLAYVI